MQYMCLIGGIFMLIEHRHSLRGEITVPGDKSISHRAILFGSIAKGVTEIDGFLMGEDCLSTIDCFRKMHVGIELLPNNKIRINGNGLKGLIAPSSTLNAGKAGTTLRLILGVLVGQSFNSVITRDESARKKSVGHVVKQLKQMGAKINGKDDASYCPLMVSPSKLTGISYKLPANYSYFKSPILLAGLYADGETRIEEDIKSRDHTELILKYFGADIVTDEHSAVVRQINELYAQHVQIPGDISIAAYLITAALLVPNSDLTIKNVGINPTRTGFIDVLKSMGAKIEIHNERVFCNEKVADIRVTSSSLKAVEIDGSVIPRLLDEVTVIIVAAAMAQGKTVINGLQGFKIKESGRLKNLITELSKMGAKAYETEDSIIVEGGKPLKGTVIESYGDHIIAMAMSIAGLIAEGETMIRKAQVVDIAFPEFYPVLNKL